MQLTPDLRDAILESVRAYSERFSIPAPRVLMSTREVLDMPRAITAGRRTTAYKYYGVSYLKYGIVFLNVKKIPDMEALKETMVHELIHVRFPYLAHGKRFDALVKRGCNGEGFDPYRPAKKAQRRPVRWRRRSAGHAGLACGRPRTLELF